MVLAEILGENLTQNILIAILIIIIFVIIFDVFIRIKIFGRWMAAIIALIITLIGLKLGYIRTLAIKILQFISGGFAIALSIILAIIFILFLLKSFGVKPNQKIFK